MPPVPSSSKTNEKKVFSDLQYEREKQKLHLRQLVSSADIKKVFSERDSTNWSKKLYAINEVIHDTIPTS